MIDQFIYTDLDGDVFSDMTDIDNTPELEHDSDDSNDYNVYGHDLLDGINDSSLGTHAIYGDDPSLYSDSVSFGHNAGTNSDGYIPDGRETLKSTISGIKKSFEVYSKDGHLWVADGGQWKRIDGSGTVVIDHIKYNKI